MQKQIEAFPFEIVELNPAIFGAERFVVRNVQTGLETRPRLLSSARRILRDLAR